jgi:hypothetical protein
MHICVQSPIARGVDHPLDRKRTPNEQVAVIEVNFDPT